VTILCSGHFIPEEIHLFLDRILGRSLIWSGHSDKEKNHACTTAQEVPLLIEQHKNTKGCITLHAFLQ
jgi:hypothetical protein